MPPIIAVLPTAGCCGWWPGTSWAAAALPALLAVELTVTALAGQTAAPERPNWKSARSRTGGIAFRAYTPWIDPATYVSAGTIGRPHPPGNRTVPRSIQDRRRSKGFLFTGPVELAGPSGRCSSGCSSCSAPRAVMRYWSYLADRAGRLLQLGDVPVRRGTCSTCSASNGSQLSSTRRHRPAAVATEGSGHSADQRPREPPLHRLARRVADRGLACRASTRPSPRRPPWSSSGRRRTRPSPARARSGGQFRRLSGLSNSTPR